MDISDRKRSEEMVRQNEALFSALIELAPVGVYVVDHQLRLQRLNPKARPVFSKVQPLIGRPLSEILRTLWPDRLADEILGHFRHTLHTGEPFFSAEFSERRRDVAITESYEWQLQRVTLPVGLPGVVCYFENVTERKQAEAALRRAEVLSASNRKLEQEILRRGKVERSLKQSEQHQRGLLAQSQLQQRQLRQLPRQILWAQEEERKRISRELHDVVAQSLTGIHMRLAALKSENGYNPKTFDRNLARTQKLVETAVESVHRFARELRPAVLDDLGLIPALHTFMHDFTMQTGVRTSLTADAGVNHLDLARRTVLFRVAQEALNNVGRHARASVVEVSLCQQADSVSLKIKDNGKSFDVAAALRSTAGKRLGLLGMRERVEFVGGRLKIESVPGSGVTITAQIPFGRTLKRGANVRPKPLGTD